MRTILALITGAVLMTGTAIAQERTRTLVTYDNVAIDLIAEGSGPLIVLLPSRGRDSEDYDSVAAGLAKEGFRVLRPQPRGMHASKGPMKDITLHDLARDVASVIARENAGPAVIVGHAYGNWVARMTAVDHPQLVRGVVLAAATALRAAATDPHADPVWRFATVKLPVRARVTSGAPLSSTAVTKTMPACCQITFSTYAASVG